MQVALKEIVVGVEQVLEVALEAVKELVGIDQGRRQVGLHLDFNIGNT